MAWTFCPNGHGARTNDIERTTPTTTATWAPIHDHAVRAVDHRDDAIVAVGRLTSCTDDPQSWTSTNREGYHDLAMSRAPDHRVIGAEALVRRGTGSGLF